MIRVVISLLAIAAAAMGQAVTSVVPSTVSHSIVQVSVSFSGAAKYLRIRYAQLPATCTGLSGGTTQPSAWNTGKSLPSNPISTSVGGLVPGTPYQICPEVSPDNSSWFGGASLSVTTLPLPAVHPAPPIPPATFDTTYPVSGSQHFQNPITYTMNSSCVDVSNGETLLQRIMDGIAVHKQRGVEIDVPPGADCVGQLTLNKLDADVKTFFSSSVSVSTSTITFLNHGFQEGQGLKLGTSYASLPNSPGNGSSDQKMTQGWPYYFCNVTTNTFQVCNQPIAQGGTPFVFTNAGSATGGLSAFYIVPWPRALNWIIVRVATPDNQFVPQGVRLQGPIVPANQSPLLSTAPVNWVPTPPTNWLQKMATIRMPLSFNNFAPRDTLLMFNDPDGNMESMLGYIRFVGFRFTWTPTTEQGSDIISHHALVHIDRWNDDIVFDRCWFAGLPPPDRVGNAFSWNGMNQAIINSYIDNMQFYHPTYVGGAVSSASSTSFAVNSFQYNWGTGIYRSPSQLTITVSGTNGSANQDAAIFVDPASQKLVVALPPGLTGTCANDTANICSIVATSMTGTGFGLYRPTNGSHDYGDPLWPKNAQGRNAVAQLGWVRFNNGQVVSAGNADSLGNEFDSEGSQTMIGGIGPGPYYFINNYLEATGTVWHHDDSGGNWAVRGDYSYVRNYMITPKSQMADLTGGNPEWDGLRYFHRHMLESKGGNRWLVMGNVYGGAWIEDTPLGDLIEFSATTLGISDVDVRYNTFAHAATLLYGPSAYPGESPGGPYTVKPSSPPMRFRFADNIAWDLDANKWCAHGAGFCWTNGAAHGFGVLFWNGVNDEDWTVDHNTIPFIAGSIPAILWTDEGQSEGFKFTNNILSIGGTGLMAGIDTHGTCAPGGTDSNCHGAGKLCRYYYGLSGWNCGLVNSPFDHNILTSTSLTQSQIQGLWPNNYVPSNPSNFSQIGFSKFTSTAAIDNDYHLAPNSPYKGKASDGTDVGANVDKLLAAQGYMKLVGVPTGTITKSAATVVFDTWDQTDSCYVDYSSTDPTLINSFSRVPDPGSTVHNVKLSNLSGNTLYSYRVSCPTIQLTGQFRTK